MRVQILPFGVLKDLLGPASRELTPGASVADLLAILGVELRSQPRAAQLLSRIAVSVNAEYANAGQILNEGDVVGLLPPVSGGAESGAAHAPAVITYLTHEVIRTQELTTAAAQGSDGAVVTFDGIVRDNTRGRQVLSLNYEAYEEMASRQMAELAAQAIERFGVRHVTLVHRLGHLEIGESSVLIVAAAAHRGAAFDACRWLIDTLKKTVPIWKKETFVDGVVWADGEPFPDELMARTGDAAEAAQ
ncbi:molybdenum cofactor biosynthesis protein [Acidicapsa ligni]|uniref:molybdenum cofactor biosynthesis protein n=1 Tax=Acidicapsa ligni TaxID=542300 RepID=UPI0021E0F9A0|nr:molybdenum cofactor biosynthesis protein MoaE [Acidicapsa ligni]